MTLVDPELGFDFEIVKENGDAQPAPGPTATAPAEFAQGQFDLYVSLRTDPGLAQPAPPSQEEQPPTLETCKTMPVDVYSKYATEEKKREMQDLVLEQGESIDDFRYKTNYGYSYNVPTDGSFIEDPYCIKTKDGTTIGVARLSTLVFYAEDGRVVAKLLPLIIDLGGDRIIAFGSTYLEGFNKEVLQKAIDANIEELPEQEGWVLGRKIGLLVPRDFINFYHKYGPGVVDRDNFYSAYNLGREASLDAGDISEEDLLLPANVDLSPR